MFKIASDELNNYIKTEIINYIREQEYNLLLIDMKELCRLVSLSRPTVNQIFMSDPSFPKMRIGKKLVFNRKAVEQYLDKWFTENNGTTINLESE